MKLWLQTKSFRGTETRDFYRSLRFQELDKHTFSEGSQIIKIVEDSKERIGLIGQLDNESILKEVTNKYQHKAWKDGVLVMTPSGCLIHLVPTLPKIETPVHHKSLLGAFAGISLESINIQASIQFWELLGLSIRNGSPEHGWVGMGDQDGDLLAIMSHGSCPHSFINPSLTYFNGSENERIIEKIRANDVPIEEEISAFNAEGKTDNLFLRDPGGIGFFIFNDG